jgi:hypothetical protein
MELNLTKAQKHIDGLLREIGDKEARRVKTPCRPEPTKAAQQTADRKSPRV